MVAGPPGIAAATAPVPNQSLAPGQQADGTRNELRLSKSAWGGTLNLGS